MNFKTTILAICFLISYLANSQNLTLAKAFYKKAQQEYSNKNYTQVFKLLDKTKEQLGGQSNPEITYLEAKTHYNNDINVGKSKTLLTQFLEEADPNDSRIDEISSLIVDIEVSDKIDEHGNFKDIKGRSGIKTTYRDTGEKEWVQEFKNGVKDGFIKRYNKKGVLIQSGSQKNGYVNGFYEWFNNEGKRYQTNYYDQYGKKTKEQKHYNTANGELDYIYTYTNDKKNGLFKTFFNGKLYSEGSYENDKLKGKYSLYYTSGVLQYTCTYNNTPSYDTKTPSFIEGIKTQYDGNGKKLYEQNYVKGKKQGIKTSYYHNGNMLSEENYVNDKKNGRQKYYHINGKLSRWEHINADGKLYGKRAYYFKSTGKKHINLAYENGKAMELLEQVDINGKKLKISKLKKGNGYIKRTNDAGVIIYEATIVNGYENGIVKRYWDNGKVSSETNYKNGYKDGIRKSYWSGDKEIIATISTYKDGKITGTSKNYLTKDGSLSYTYDNDNDKIIINNSIEFQRKTVNKLIEENKSIEEIIAFCNNKNPAGKDFYLSESVINSLGYYYLNDKKNAEDALKIFKLNIEFYPKAWNTYDSLGECLAKLNRINEATQAFNKSLELNPKNENAIIFLKNPNTFFAKTKPNANKIIGENFLKENKTKKGVQTTASGLQYIILKEGKGEKPKSTDVKVKVHYYGTTIEGNIIDSSIERGEPIELNIKGLIKGWTEGIQMMSVGSKYKFFMPHDLAYGNGQMGVVKPYSVLIYEIELLEIINN